MQIDVEFARFVGQAIVIGVGWWVVHALSLRRERDKARRELVAKTTDSMGDAVTSILIECRAYHLQLRESASELRLKMSLQDLAMRAAGLSDICSNPELLSTCRSDIAGLRRAITGQHFEDEHLDPLGDGDAQLQAIAEMSLRAKRSLQRLKHNQFPA